MKNEIEKLIGHTIKNIDFFLEAFTHKSFANENPNFSHNERLEFLGDAVLELAVTEFLFEKFPEEDEGKMTKLRSAIVNTNSLAATAKKMGLGELVKMSRGETANRGFEKKPILANVFEAVIGALYRDGGFSAAQKFIEKNLFPRLDEILEKDLHLDPKSAFQEWAQEHHEKTPNYKILNESGPDHNKVFVAGVFVGEKKMGEGTGSSKQKAEIDAAKSAIENLKK